MITRVVKSDLGNMIIDGDGRAIHSIGFTEYATNWNALTPPEKDAEKFMQWCDQIAKFNFDEVVFELKAKTQFTKDVWEAIMHIPSGTTVSYKDLAIKMGKPNAVRAVASACAKNNLALLIPCHRVIRSDGELGLYRWGADLKRRILESEKQNAKP